MNNKLMTSLLRIVSLLILLIPAVSAMAQGLVLTRPAYDFGLLKEAAGRRTGRVMLVNRGDTPDFILRVRPSCGCTDADFQKGEIAPGDSAWVSFTYDPAGRPGKFDKTVRIILGDGSRKQLLKIRGTVLGTPASLDRLYPVDRGDLRFSEGEVDLGKVRSGSTRHAFVNAYNTREDSLPLRISSSNLAVDVSVYPRIVGPGDAATFSFYLNTRRLPGDGEVAETFTVTDSVSGKILGELPLRALVVPDANGLSASGAATAPRLETPRTVLALGDLKPGKTREFSLVLENGGNSPLRLINIICSDKGVSLGKLPASIEPGRRVVIGGKIRHDKKASGPFRIPLEIISDDPLHPSLTIFISGAYL